MGYRIVVAGATGNVGREMLNILAERQFPADEIAALASPRSTGDVIDFGDSGTELKVRNIEHFDFAGWDMALFAAGSAVSEWVGDAGRVVEFGTRFTKPVVVPAGGADVVITGTVKSVEPESRRAVVDVTVTAGGDKVLGRCVATVQLD